MACLLDLILEPLKHFTDIAQFSLFCCRKPSMYLFLAQLFTPCLEIPQLLIRMKCYLQGSRFEIRTDQQIPIERAFGKFTPGQYSIRIGRFKGSDTGSQFSDRQRGAFQQRRIQYGGY